MSAPSSKKGSNRVKGNLKPSSSSQAANLLSGHSGGFIGFGAQSSPSFVPLSQLLDDVDSTLDSDIRLVLRKLSKRDTITKLKALQELGDICEQKDSEVLKSMLPFWPRLYNKLAMDLDYKVREAVHQTFQIITNKVGKEIAPYLKSIIGCWVVCQCDTYPTVASSANQVFQSTFPSTKQKDALTVYRQDIFDFLVDNLVNQTPHSLSDPKTSNLEDMENKYTRIIGSSLTGSRKLIELVSAEKISSLESSLISLFENGKFWKHSKSTVPGVKGGMFSFLAIVCQRFPQIVNNFLDKIAPLVLHNLDISTPAIVGPMWEAVLSLVNYIPESWNKISWQKAFWPKLRKLLEKAFYGNASTVAPNIMPLISKIPDSLSGDRSTFHAEFLACYRTGLKNEVSLNSNIECAALVRSYIECCRFILSQVINSEEIEDQLSKSMLDQFVLELVTSSITDTSSALSASPLYPCVGSLMVMVEKSAGTSELSKWFWNQLGDFVCCQLDKASPVQSQRISMLVKRFLTLSASPKTRFNIKFADGDLKPKKVGKKSTVVNSEMLTNNFTEFYTQMLSYLLNKMKSLEDHNVFLTLFSGFFNIYITDAILANILCPDEKTTENMFACFFENICLSSLKKSTNSVEISENIISISLKCLENSNRVNVSTLFAKLIDSSEGLVQYCLIIEQLTERYRYESNAKELFKSPAVSEMIIRVVKLTCSLSTESTNLVNKQQIEHGWNAITMVLSSCGEEDSVVDSKCVEAILLAIGEELNTLSKGTSSEAMNQAIQLVTRAACSFFDNLTDVLCLTATEELMISLFSISLDSSYNLQSNTLENCELAWTKGLQLLFKTQQEGIINGQFMSKACEILKKAVFTECSISDFNRICKHMEILLNLESENRTLNSKLIQDLFKRLLIEESDSSRFTPMLNYVYAARNFLSVSENIPPCISHFTLDLHLVINVATMNIKLLQFILLRTLPIFRDVVSQHTFKSEHVLNPCETECLLSVFRLFAVTQSFMEHVNPKTEKHLLDMFNTLKISLCRTVDSVAESDKRLVLQTIISNSEKHGELDSVVLHSVLGIMVPKYYSLNEKQMIDSWEDISTGTLHTIQSVVPFFATENIYSLVKIQTATFMSSLSTTNEWLGVRSLAVIISCLRTLAKSKQSDCSIDKNLKSFVKPVLEHILSWRETEENFLVCSDNDLKDVIKTAKNIEVIKFLTLAVEEAAEEFSDKEWDMVLCCLVDWVQINTVCESLGEPTVLVVTFVAASCDLLLEVSKCMETKVKSNPTFPENLWTEWDEFFCDGVFGSIITLYVSLVGGTITNPLSKIVVVAMGKALSYCSKNQIIKHKLPSYLTADDDSSIPPSIQTFLNHISPFLLSDQISIQATAYNLLEKLMDSVTLEYGKTDEDTSAVSEEECTKSPPKVFIDIMRRGESAMDVVLVGVSMGSSFMVEPGTEEYQFAYGYILAWKLILYFFQTADPQMRAMYATYFRDNGLFSKLLHHIFCFLPPEKLSPTQSLEFSKIRSLCISAHTSSPDIQQQALSLYYQCLEKTPALVRQWWMDLDRKTSLFVDKFTSKYVSPYLCAEEISSVQPSSDDLQGITIKPRPATREVVATYIMADVKIVVTITLPENFPLGVITVSSEKRVGATQAQWDRLLLQLNIFLQHQNGTIIEGLKLWKKNIDKRFDGVEDCMICYSVLHGTTYQLPKLQCRTCKKKYHSACLYKWFSTSMNSTCPLCRNLF